MSVSTSPPTTDFKVAGAAIAKRFKSLSKNELYTVELPKEVIWEAYLNAYPAGTNLIFRERTEHDCNCCRQFVCNAGRLAAIIDGKLCTVWEVKNVGYPYDAVFAVLDAEVRKSKICSVFRTTMDQYGAAQTLEVKDEQTLRWNHFEAKIAPRHKPRQGKSPEEACSFLNASKEVLERGLKELSPDAGQQVAELISEGALYRGDEHSGVVIGFRELQRRFSQLTTETDKQLFVWGNIHDPAARFKNTVIGTLVSDISNGTDLDAAVRKFEAKVAPANYKRPSSVITPRMIKAAVKTLDDNGLTTSLERRLARLSDVSVNDVLFVDNSARGQMKGGIEAVLMEAAVPAVPNFDSATEVKIDAFLTDVLPTARSVDLLVSNAMLNNFMTLTTAVHGDAPHLFKWDNPFAWSYDGDVADSIKTRVKRAGGDVEAAIRTSLGWFNTDDLDLHMITPDNRHIYFSNKAGILDVDMNAGGKFVTNAVENMRLQEGTRNGVYAISVHNYAKRQAHDTGFDLEVECEGVRHEYKFPNPVPNNKHIKVLDFHVKNSRVTDITVKDKNVIIGSSAYDKWGVTSNKLAKVNVMLTSPNHWGDNAVGNKHWLFVLDGCANPEPTRGIYNEFLRSGLETHRKVFEILGAKTKCEPTAEQLSGVGFSATRRDTANVLVRTGTSSRPYTLKF